MLEVLKGTDVSRSYENKFFRKFATGLEELFSRRGFDGLLIGFPECSVDPTLQIDALLVTNNAICIIDFKNYKGNVQLPSEKGFETQIWTNNKVKIRGGASDNPFLQLSSQKDKLKTIIESIIIKHLPNNEQITTDHIIKIVCFQETINLIGTIPRRHELSFHIMDSHNFLTLIEDILDVKTREVRIGPVARNFFKKHFKADPSYELRIQQKETEYKLHLESLKAGQWDALKAIRDFLKKDENNIFILDGTTNSGKSYIIDAICYEAKFNGFAHVYKLAPNAKTAKSFDRYIDDPFTSIYSHIFDYGEDTDFNNEDTNENDDIIQKIPLKQSVDAYNALYIVDEAQFINNNIQSNPLIQFGSGYLLDDFMSFCELNNTMRKIIFIGDNYQYTGKGSDTSAINWDIMRAKYKKQVRYLTLDKRSDLSIITKNSLICSDAIEKNTYNKLEFTYNDQFSKNDENGVLSAIGQDKSFPLNSIILTYSNEQARKYNQLIKQNVSIDPEIIASNDLVVFHNSVSGIGIKNRELESISSGQFATISKVFEGNPIKHTISDKYGTHTFLIKKLHIRLESTKVELELHYSEDFFLGISGFRDINKQKALQKLMMIKYHEELKKYTFIDSLQFQDLQKDDDFMRLSIMYPETTKELIDKPKTKVKSDEEKQLAEIILEHYKSFQSQIKYNLRNDPDSDYFKLANLAMIKYGWAVTLDKATPLKWDNVILISKRQQGKNNRHYFSWMYSGISRAINSIQLVGFEKINPYANTVISTSNQKSDSSKPFFTIQDFNLDTVTTMIEGKLKSLLQSIDICVEHLKSSQYQERFKLCTDNDFTEVSIAYKGNGNVSYPKHTKASSDDFKKRIDSLLEKPISSIDLDAIDDHPLRVEYHELKAAMEKHHIHFVDLEPYFFRDRITLSSDTGRLEADFIYDKKNLVTKIDISFCSDTSILEILERYIKDEPEDNYEWETD